MNKVMVVIPREEIEKNLIRSGEIDWDYFKSLKELDRQDGTENYGEAMFVLRNRNLVSPAPNGNYLVINGFILEPKVASRLFYFRKEEDAKGFRDTFLSQGIVAKVVS